MLNYSCYKFCAIHKSVLVQLELLFAGIIDPYIFGDI